MLSQCIMKIPGVFVNIASGATRRPDVELRKETARRLCRVPPYAWPQTIHQLQTSISSAELDLKLFVIPLQIHEICITIFHVDLSITVGYEVGYLIGLSLDT